jgi:hypothetical protein
LAVNFLLIESLQRFYQYYGDDVQVECPTGSGDYMNLLGVAEEIQHRIIHIFARDNENRRATNGGDDKLDFDPNFRDYVWFYEVRYVAACRRRIMTPHAVLPRRRWSWSRRVAPDRLVRSCRVPHPAERRDLPPTEDTEESVCAQLVL